jgi:hypothetical protein
MNNRITSLPAHNDPMPLHRHGGKITAMSELQVGMVGDDYTVEGAGTIRSLPSFSVGVSFILSLLGTPTFVHSSKLLCPDSVNYTGEPNDLLIARSIGDGAWRIYVLRQGVTVTPPQGRPTLTSGTPVMTSSVAGATTVYYAFNGGGNQCPVWNGSTFVMKRYTELSQTTTDTTKSPAAVAANKNYDLFVSGAFGLSRGPTWDSGAVAGSDNVRGTGAGSTELVWVNGIAVNKYDITNGPAAGFGTYVGTIRSNSSSTIDFIYGAVGAGGVAAVFNVWSAYNRVEVSTLIGDSTTTWTYAVASVWRAANASSAMRVGGVRGLNVDFVDCAYDVNCTPGSGVVAASALALNSTTVPVGSWLLSYAAASGVGTPQTSKFKGLAGLGVWYVQAIEVNGSTTLSTWSGKNSSGGIDYSQSGINATVWL